jgi:protease I
VNLAGKKKGGWVFGLLGILVWLQPCFALAEQKPTAHPSRERQTRAYKKAWEGVEKMNTIVMVIAPNGFRDEEYFVPKELFLHAGYEVLTAALGGGIAHSKFGKTVKVDLDLPHMDLAECSALVFVGGPGTKVYFDLPSAHRLAHAALEQDKVLAAICIAPVILARAGILKGRRATVFPDGENDLAQGGAINIRETVAQDGKIITGNGPAAAEIFAQTVLRALEKKSHP